MIAGEKALSSLAESASAADPAASSHWRAYHETFRVENGKVSGLRGFGGDTGRGPLKSAAHWLLQAPFRRHLKDRSLLQLAGLAAERQGRTLDLDVLRQALTLDLLQERLPAAAFDKTLVVIGDGFGMLSSLLLLRYPKSKVVLVNLTKTLLVDLVYASRAAPGLDFALAESADDLRSGPRLTALRAEDCEALRGLDFGAAMNVASMQEMDPPVVARYFELLRSAGTRPYFYCCNREEKRLPDGTMVRFSEYPWKAEDETLLDELCPWHQSWYRPVPPFYFPYDGPIRHRLIRMAGPS